MPITIALAGNPNCGKTTMFNALTGAAQYVGNWPGVTVEKKEGRLRGHEDVVIMDLPGIYSLSPYTLEEVVTRSYLLDESPDVILNLVDASNIERNLYLSTQLMELGTPVVIALNMMDVVRRNGDRINLAKLSEALGCPVVETAAIRSEGTLAAAEAAIAQRKQQHTVKPILFSARVETTLQAIDALLPTDLDPRHRRWFAIKLFERDEKVLARFAFDAPALNQLDTLINDCEIDLEDDAESIITNERYTHITDIIRACVVKNRPKNGRTTSDRIDHILTHRVLALPIFALLMFGVYYIAVTTVGSFVTDFMNDTLFGTWISPAVESFLTHAGTAGWLTGLIVDGIIGGVGAVLGFVPQMFVLFFLLSILEDCGYMSRIAFIMDRIFRRLGLSGKSFIPLLVSTGCGVPGIMASRTIEQDRDRKMTIITATFIPCGAKMPIIALIAGAMFGGAWWVAPSGYFVGIGAVVLSGLILKKTRMFAGNPAPFVMELPPYHLPTLTNILRGTWERGFSFIKKAGTVILLASIVIWVTSSFGFTSVGFGMVDSMEDSVLSNIGGAIAVIFAPLGFGTWQSAIATVLGLLAKEEVVGVFGTLYAVGGDALELTSNGDFGMLGNIASHFTHLSAYSFLVFNLLCAPCVAAMGAIRREMNSAKWTFFALGYQTGFAYAMSLMVYQIGGLLTGEAPFTVFTAIAFVVLAVLVYLVARPMRQTTDTPRSAS